jgi:hypothetical protein
MRVVAIDGDIIVYSCGFAADDEPLAHCLSTVKKMVQNICAHTGADIYTIYLTGRNNFRKDVATLQGYKENRKDKPKPRHLEDIREYLINVHDAIVIEDAEADDALGEWLSEKGHDEDRVLASLDKDLDMIAGEHFNWRSNHCYTMPEDEADMFFGKQLLTGDSTDNIPGLYKMGGAKVTRKLVDAMEDNYREGGFGQMVEAVRAAYRAAKEVNEECRMAKEDLNPDAVVDEIGELLWIRRTGAKSFKELCND